MSPEEFSFPPAQEVSPEVLSQETIRDLAKSTVKLMEMAGLSNIDVQAIERYFANPCPEVAEYPDILDVLAGVASEHIIGNKIENLPVDLLGQPPAVDTPQINIAYLRQYNIFDLFITTTPTGALIETLKECLEHMTTAHTVEEEISPAESAMWDRVLDTLRRVETKEIKISTDGKDVDSPEEVLDLDVATFIEKLLLYTDPETILEGFYIRDGSET